jgi:molybdopterin-guanine dinucleotide biosynthesis protein A
MIDSSRITGLVLAGGQGTRMGGVDKGLQLHNGMPLARHAMLRLAPQVGRVVLNANRHLADYAAMGAPVWADTLPDQPGPLAGFLAGLERCETPYLATVPCDSPLFPQDLVLRLGEELEREGAEAAMAATREANELRLQPVFCLMERSAAEESLRRFTAGGRRRISGWAATLHVATVIFDDARAFANVNTLAELGRLQGQG